MTWDADCTTDAERVAALRLEVDHLREARDREYQTILSMDKRVRAAEAECAILEREKDLSSQMFEGLGALAAQVKGENGVLRTEIELLRDLLTDVQEQLWAVNIAGQLVSAICVAHGQEPLIRAVYDLYHEEGLEPVEICRVLAQIRNEKKGS